MNQNPIVIIGAGPAGLMAAQKLAEKGHKVHIYEQNKAAARKFLVAGHGGFNLTHSEEIDSFVQKYDSVEIQNIVRYFTNQDSIDWLLSISVPTYVGSSGKIFPAKHIKPIQVLQAWLDRLESLGVVIHYEHQFIDFNEEKVQIQSKDQLFDIQYNKLILALGGGSWKKTGSDAKWVSILQNKSVPMRELEAANSGYDTSETFQKLEGQIIKNIQVAYENNSKLGEIVFTTYGIEGSPIYYLNRFTRNNSFPLLLHLDLKPNITVIEILNKLNKSSHITSTLKNALKLNTTAINLLKILDRETFTNPEKLTQMIKKYPIEVFSLRPIDEVISTAGGVKFEGLNTDLSLKNYPNVHCIGEMLDWEAPTGGYLLQACFSTGAYVANTID